MSRGSLLAMALTGLVALGAGAGLLLSAGARVAPAARYGSRLAGTMFAAVGLILIVFAASWTLSPHPA